MRVLVIGAYGHFGKLICKQLIGLGRVEVVAAGRNTKKIEALGSDLSVQAITLDWRREDLSSVLVNERIHLVVHAAGPYQRQCDGVARACIAAGCYYTDLADDRDFVSRIRNLDARAKAANVMVASGLGLTALHMAMLERLEINFTEVEHIHIGFSGDGRMPGLASVESALHSCGRPVNQIEGRREVVFTGLLGRHLRKFGNNFMCRDVVNMQAPDLDSARVSHNPLTLRYQGGFGLRGQRMIGFLAKISHYGWLKNPKSLASQLRVVGKLMTVFSRGKGAVYVEVEGKWDRQRVEHAVEIHSTGGRFDELKVVATIAFVKRLLNNFIPDSGAYPAIGLVTLQDIEDCLDPDYFKIYAEP